MKRNHVIGKGNMNKPSKKKAPLVATVQNISANACLPTALDSTLSLRPEITVAPSLHRTIMQLCHSNLEFLQNQGGIPIQAPSYLSLRSDTSRDTMQFDSSSATSMRNDEHYPLGNSVLSSSGNHSSPLFVSPLVAETSQQQHTVIWTPPQVQDNKLEAILILQQDIERQRLAVAAASMVAASATSNNSGHVSHDINHCVGRQSNPFHLASSNNDSYIDMSQPTQISMAFGNSMNDIGAANRGSSMFDGQTIHSPIDTSNNDSYMSFGNGMNNIGAVNRDPSMSTARTIHSPFYTSNNNARINMPQANQIVMSFGGSNNVTTIGAANREHLQFSGPTIHSPTMYPPSTMHDPTTLSSTAQLACTYTMNSLPVLNPRGNNTTTGLGIQQKTSSSMMTESDYHHHTSMTSIALTDAAQLTNRLATQSLLPPSIASTGIILELPVCVATRIDVYKLSPHQCFLREQIEYFAATADDVMIPIRGRNKQISLGQVGIRCRHCAHVPISYRQKGSTYFPSGKLGLYQAAQNMSSTHLQCGLCDYTPEYIKTRFAEIMIDKRRNDNGAGRPYWIKSATQSGLIDTEEHGIRLIHCALPTGARLLVAEMEMV